MSDLVKRMQDSIGCKVEILTDKGETVKGNAVLFEDELDNEDDDLVECSVSIMFRDKGGALDGRTLYESEIKELKIIE